MPEIEAIKGVERARLTVELPLEHVDTARMMLNGIKGRRQLTVAPVIPHPPANFPRLYTMIDDDKERPVPAVQRSHIREFVSYTDSDPRLATRFISVVWGGSSPNLPFYDAAKDRRLFRSTALLDSSERTIALKAFELPRLHQLLIHNRVRFPQFGPQTINFVGEL